MSKIKGICMNIVYLVLSITTEFTVIGFLIGSKIIPDY